MNVKMNVIRLVYRFKRLIGVDGGHESLKSFKPSARTDGTKLIDSYIMDDFDFIILAQFTLEPYLNTQLILLLSLLIEIIYVLLRNTLM